LLVEPLLAQGRLEAFRVDLAADEEGLAASVHNLALGPADHHAIQEAAVAEHAFGGIEETFIEQVDEGPELEIVALVRGGGEEKQVAGMALETFEQAVVHGDLLLLAVTDAADVVGLIHDDQIEPGSIQDTLHAGRALHGVNGSDDAVVVFPACRGEVLEINAENLKLEAEAVAQFVLPVFDEAGRAENEDAGGLATGD